MKIAKEILLVPFLLTVLCVADARATEVKSDYDRSYPLHRFQAFTFVAQHNTSPADALAGDELVARRIQSAITRNLITIGCVEEKVADFAVTFRAVVRNQAQLSTSGFPRLGTGRLWVDNYTVGTIIVEFRDAKSGDLVWRGSVSGTVDPNKNEEKINAGIKKLIARFAKDREKQQAGKK